MKPELIQLREFLKAQYGRLYDRQDWEFSDVLQTIKQPVWLWHSSDLRIAEMDDASGCAVYDPDIGQCVFFQIFTAATPVRDQIQRALSIRASLQRRMKVASADTAGAWRVMLYCLMAETDFPDWIGKVAELREQTAHFEEIPTDAIVSKKGNWEQTFKSHGLPRFLFRTRTILKKKDAKEIEQWQSADHLVRLTLANLQSEFSDPLVQQCAREVLEQITPDRRPASTTTEVQRKDLSGLEISAFRNIDRLHLQFQSGASNVQATVIQGPNGSGKSSVYEALSLAVIGTSPRYQKYLEDKDRRLRSKSDQYLAHYLTNLGSGSTAPQLGLEGGPLRPITLAPADETAARLRKIRGTFLSQDSSREFLAKQATDLGAEIAAGLSVIAADANAFASAKFSGATDRVRDFNRRWDLRANITRQETVLEQIGRRLLNAKLPNFSELIAWASSDLWLNLRYSIDAQRVATGLSSLQRATDAVVTAISKNLSGDLLAVSLEGHLQNISTQQVGAQALISALRESTRLWQADDEEKLNSWGKWLEARSLTAREETPRVRRLKVQEAAASETLALLAAEGKVLSDRISQIQSVQPFLESWTKDHADTCPTCDSDVSDRGGIHLVVTELFANLIEKRDAARTAYQEARRQLNEAQNLLADEGFSPPPVETEEQARLISEFAWLTESGLPLEGALESAALRQQLLTRVRFFRRQPAIPTVVENIKEWAEEFAKELDAIKREHYTVSQLPDAWKQVQKVLGEKLSAVTAQHLPETIEALWQEIAKNLMPAAWQQPGPIHLQAAAKARPEAAITIEGEGRSVLANYILNGAEIHNLGLAWFFATYFLVGRFEYSFLILDDPSDAMDQATYRDLCRFLETMLRLHKIEGVPLSLVMLLHQDERALDVARATDAVLYMLRWNKHTKTINRPMRVYGEQLQAPIPEELAQAG